MGGASPGMEKWHRQRSRSPIVGQNLKKSLHIRVLPYVFSRVFENFGEKYKGKNPYDFFDFSKNVQKSPWPSLFSLYSVFENIQFCDQNTNGP